MYVNYTLIKKNEKKKSFCGFLQLLGWRPKFSTWPSSSCCLSWTAYLIPNSSGPGLFPVLPVCPALPHLRANSSLLLWSNNLSITSSGWNRIFCDSPVRFSVPLVRSSHTTLNFSLHNSLHLGLLVRYLWTVLDYKLHKSSTSLSFSALFPKT